jgi:hypothetical protein
MEQLAATLPPDELNRVGFKLYERFRPDVPPGAEGWGAKGVLEIERIVWGDLRRSGPLAPPRQDRHSHWKS